MNDNMRDWLAHCRKPENYAYMVEQVLIFGRYSAPSAEWTHDHCEFCWARFSEDGINDLHEGYSTEDRYNWVCEECFRLFRDVYRWEIQI